MDVETTRDESAADRYARALIDAATREGLPELFGCEHPEALYRVADRNGVSVVVLTTAALSEAQLTTLMKYRLAQYLATNFVDRAMIHEAGMEHEPLSGVSPDDVHVVAGSVATGEILCYAVIKAAPSAPPSATLRDHDRPLFPVEKVHGWGIYNRLRVLPDLPLVKLREVGRFVKNQRLHTFDELGARAPVEVGVALFRALAGPLRLEVEAAIGDLEEGVAKQNLEFFHAPLVVLHGTVPYEPEASYFFPRYQYCSVYPFAVLCTDITRQMMSRLAAIEAALEQPGKQGLLNLFALKRDTGSARSSLEPPEGVAALVDSAVPQQALPMATRQQMLDLGDRLRETNLLRGLSVGEAAVLGTFMERIDTAPGDVIVRQGDPGDSLFLIETGLADVTVGAHGREPLVVAQLGPGDYFGEIALLTGEPRIADVVAAGPMTLLRLTKEAYARYLGHAAEVERHMTQTALSRSLDTARKSRVTEQRA